MCCWWWWAEEDFLAVCTDVGFVVGLKTFLLLFSYVGSDVRLNQ